jgi:hypothetical protein
MYILKLLLKVVIAGIEALVSGNKFVYACVKKKSAACELSHVLSPSINTLLLLKSSDPNQFFR